MSDDFAEHAARLDQLEIRIAHQDRVIAELNEVMTSQWRRIDALVREITRLREEYQAIEVPREAPEPPPPHY